jgi:FkbM family methyltransferase
MYFNKPQIFVCFFILILITCLIYLLSKIKLEHFKQYWETHDPDFLNNAKLEYFNKKILSYNLKQENDFIVNILLNSPKNVVFLDIGAFDGSTCLYIAKKLKEKKRDDIKILAFEPNLSLSNKINNESKKNNLNVKCINIVVSNNNTGVFKKTDEGAGTMYNTHFKNDKYDSDTLDNILNKLKIDKVFFMKIDTEGHEPKVLEGAKNILKNTSHLYIEVWSDTHYEERSSKKIKYNKIIIDNLKDFYAIQKIEKNYYFKNKNT